MTPELRPFVGNATPFAKSGSRSLLQRARRDSAFVLIVTIILVAFLVLILVGLATFTRVETQVASNTQHMAAARQNALMALNLALGELQENLGPDRRSSATAELVIADFDTPSQRSARNPYWVGAWNTEGGFRGWLVSGNESIPQPPDPANDVAAADVRVTPLSPITSAAITADKPTGYTIPVTGASDPVPAVLLVGDNTVGSAGTPSQRYVFAPVRDLRATPPGLDGEAVIGRYAWWVGDEGVKANLALPVRPVPAAGADMPDRLRFLASPQNRGFPVVGAPWDRWSPEYTGAGQIPNFANTQARVLSRKQLAFASAGLAAEERTRFHEFTTFSAGVLSDSRLGGLRKDLSTAFEIPEVAFRNSEFTRVLTAGEKPHAYATDHANRLQSGRPLTGRSTKTAINFRDDSWASGLVYRGPTYDQLRDHYQLYRRVSQPFAADASAAAQVFQPNAPDTLTTGGTPAWHVRAPWGDYYGNAGIMTNANEGLNYQVEDQWVSGTTTRTRIRPVTTELVPEVVRYSYVMALQSYKDAADDPQKSRIRLFVNPFIVLHNPYDVTLTTPPLWIRVIRAELGVRITVGPGKDATASLMYFTNSTTAAYQEQLAGGHNSSYQAVDHFLSDNGNPNPSGANPGSITLKPGELKLYTIRGSSPTNIDATFSPSRRNLYFQALDSNDPAQLFSTGVYKTLQKRVGTSGNIGETYFIDDADTFTVTVDNNAFIEQGQRPEETSALGETGVEAMKFITKVVRPFSGDPDPLVNADLNWPHIKRHQFFNSSYWQGPPANNIPVTLSNAQIAGDISAPGGGSRFYVAQTDVYWKPLFDGDNRDNNFSLISHNPRAMIQTGMAAGSQGPNSTRGPAHWTGSSELLNGTAPNFNARFWGSGTTPGAGGHSNVVLWSVPRAPLTSIAGFRHANISRLWTAPAYAVGNSYASPYVPADRTWRSQVAPQTPAGVYWNLDDSYIFNQALFDTYFFSGVNPGLNAGATAWNNALSNSAAILGASDPTSATPLQTQINDWIAGTANPANPLLNSRLRFNLPAGRSLAQANADLNVASGYATAQTKLDAASDIRAHNAIAAYALQHGTFNVNSVSVDAWRALLASVRGSAVDHFSNLAGSPSLRTESSASRTPFPRSSVPGEDADIGDDYKLWNGFRSLTDAQITTLANEIVEQIRTRARSRPGGAAPRPFTTLGEFVNRRLAPASDSTSLKGLLQAAIDSTVNQPASSLTDQPVRAAETHFVTRKRTPDETVTTNYANPSALAAATLAGTPQWFTQADLLERIGPQLSARSDTFTVRTYGEAVNPVTGVVEGRAWLEAVVQRDTAFVNLADHPALPISTVSAESQNFGRKFKVVSFRWLSPDDI